MLNNIVHNLTSLAESGWSMWAGILGDMPYWDPYGAVTSLVAILVLAGLAVKLVME